MIDLVSWKITVRFKIESHDFLFILSFWATVIFGFEEAFAGRAADIARISPRAKATEIDFFEYFTWSEYLRDHSVVLLASNTSHKRIVTLL